MKQLFIIVLIAAIIALPAGGRRALAQDSATAPAGAGGDEVIARVDGRTITLSQLTGPLVEGYGLNVLLNLVTLDLAKKTAHDAHVTVSPQDISAEHDYTIERMFRESNQKLIEQLNEARDQGKADEARQIEEQIRKDNQQAFEQFLQNQRISRAEFDIVTETNAYLRKVAEPLLAGKISDEALKEAFGALYGERVKVRHIQCANLQEVQEAKRRLDAGEPFEKVARELSRNPRTRLAGGELPEFSRAMTGLPEAFKDAAFALKEGEVSDPIMADGAYHLIKLEKRLPPKAVKFEDVKESIRQDLHERAVQATMRDLRNQIGKKALETLEIEQPELRRQFEARKAKQEAALKDQSDIRRKFNEELRQRNASTTAPAGGSELDGLSPATASAPAPAPATQPAAVP